VADLKHQAERVRQLTINPEALPDTSTEGTTVPNINIIRRVVLQPKPTPLATLPGIATSFAAHLMATRLRSSIARLLAYARLARSKSVSTDHRDDREISRRLDLGSPLHAPICPPPR
jgi:hypothetical protein